MKTEKELKNQKQNSKEPKTKLKTTKNNQKQLHGNSGTFPKVS